MQDPAQFPEKLLPRLRFQANAADIQLAITGVVKNIQAFFRDLQTRGSWTQGRDDEMASSLVRDYWLQKDRWSQLEPPEPLWAIWREVDEALGEFGILVEKVPLLGAVPQENLLRDINGLREEFAAQLSGMNSLEEALLNEETRLRDEAQEKKRDEGQAKKGDPQAARRMPDGRR